MQRGTAAPDLRAIAARGMMREDGGSTPRMNVLLV